MQKSGPSQVQGSIDPSPRVRDEAIPGFVVSSLVAGLPFLGLMMTVAILSGQEQVGRLVSLLGTLIVEGLCFAFFWRRVDPTAGKNFAVATYAVGLWAFMGGCLVTTFGLRFGGMVDLAKNVALLGSGVIATSGFFFAIVWAQSQPPRLMVQTHTMIATSVVLAGFTALLLKGNPSVDGDHGESLSAHIAPSGEGSHDGTLQTSRNLPGEAEVHAAHHDGPSDHGAPRDQGHPGPKSEQADANHSGKDRDPGSSRDKKLETASHIDGTSSDEDHAEDDLDSSVVHEWSYEGTTGPETWGKLKPDWKTCAAGREQSPIEIAKGFKESRRVISLSYEESSARLVSNGELLQVAVEKGSHAIINGKAYELRRLDFHSPSEHALSGVSYPMEIQFVHMDTKGRTAIISAFVERGPTNPELGKILASLPIRAGSQRHLKGLLNLGRVLPRELTVLAHQYHGSLTTPPCTEGVVWTVLKTPLRMSGEQLTAYRAQFAGSNRPVQPLGKRHIGPLDNGSRGDIGH